MGVFGAASAAYASPYLFSSGDPTERRVQETYASDAKSRFRAMQTQSSAPPLEQSPQAHVLDNGGLSAPSREQRSFMQNFEYDNSAVGRPDNLQMTSTVYKPEQYRIENFKMPGDDMLSWGITPTATGRNGAYRPEWNSPSTLKPPKREVSQALMYEPEGNANNQWGEVELSGMEWARDNAANSMANKYNSAQGALDDYNPFDFEGGAPTTRSGKVMPQGTAQGRYWTKRHGNIPSSGRGFGDGTRIVYPGSDMKRGLIQYSSRPVATNGSTIGGPVVRAQQYRHKGRWAERFSVAEWTRAPVHETTVGTKHAVFSGEDSQKCNTNRQMPMRCDESAATLDFKTAPPPQDGLLAGEARIPSSFYEQ